MIYEILGYTYNQPIPKISHVKHYRTCVKLDSNNN